MNKIIILIFIIFCISSVKAQYVIVRGLENGLNVAMFMEISINGKIIPSARTNGMSYSKNQNNTVTRTYANFRKGEFFGYEMEIEKTINADKYKVIIKPPSESYRTQNVLAGKVVKSMLKSSYSQVVDDGDTIAIDVFENQAINEKVTDYIKVTKEYKPFGNYFPEKNKSLAKDFTLEDVELKLSKFDIYINREKLTQISGAVSGNLLWLNFPKGKNKGRFIFSIIPRAGYNFQKAGTLKDYTIEFDYNGDNYQIVSSVPIISTHHTWNLWILHDSNYASENDNSDYGAGTTVDGIFKKYDNR